MILETNEEQIVLNIIIWTSSIKINRKMDESSDSENFQMNSIILVNIQEKIM